MTRPDTTCAQESIGFVRAVDLEGLGLVVEDQPVTLRDLAHCHA